MKKITFLLLFVFQFGFCQTPMQFYQDVPVSGHAFGSRVDIYNNEVLVASDTFTLVGPPSPGKVFLYNFEAGFHQAQTFYPANGFLGDGFGTSMSIANNFIAIGAPNHGVGNDNTGIVYLYHKVNGEYQLMQELSAFDLAFDQTFGDHVKLHGDYLFVSSKMSFMFTIMMAQIGLFQNNSLSV